MKLIVNGKVYSINTRRDKKLLWVLRDELRLTGTKYGCGKALCGFCTVLLDGRAVRSCQIPVYMAEGKEITTIEGVPEDHPVKIAWLELDVPQCGYCQPGQIIQAQIIQAIDLLSKNKDPTEEEIILAMYGNLCRCGTYPLMREKG